MRGPASRQTNKTARKDSMRRHVFATVLFVFSLCSCQDRLTDRFQDLAADAAIRDAGIDACPTGQDCTPPPPPQSECDTCCPSCPAPVRVCARLGCEFAPWDWCGVSDTPCDGFGQFSADPTAQQCERGAVGTCNGIGFPTSECYITFAQSCSSADAAAAYQHCIRSRHLPPGSACQLIWR